MADFRSDTVTRPTAGMRDAMFNASVGDDVFGDDPTVNLLQTEAADLLGFEAALYAPSGTQSNLIGIMSQCGRGDEVILGQMAHTYRWEGGGMAVLGSIQPQPIENEADGTLSLQKVRAAIKPDDPHFARTAMLALENSFNGRVLPLDYLAEAASLGREAGLRLHLDGARLFNAAVALALADPEKQANTHLSTSEAQRRRADAGQLTAPNRSAVIDKARAICRNFDTVSICLSKGLGCPIGSLILGSREVLARGRRIRKMLGGGLRQAGFMAAAGRYALAHHLERLAIDHELATQLASGLKNLADRHPAIAGRMRVDATPTNMVFVDLDVDLASPLTRHLTGQGLKFTMSTRSDGSVRQRWVTHLDVDRENVDDALSIWNDFKA